MKNQHKPKNQHKANIVKIKAGDLYSAIVSLKSYGYAGTTDTVIIPNGVRVPKWPASNEGTKQKRKFLKLVRQLIENKTVTLEFLAEIPKKPNRQFLVNITLEDGRDFSEALKEATKGDLSYAKI